MLCRTIIGLRPALASEMQISRETTGVIVGTNDRNEEISFQPTGRFIEY